MKGRADDDEIDDNGEDAPEEWNGDWEDYSQEDDGEYDSEELPDPDDGDYDDGE